jgi:helix-turn-helix protein
MPQRSTTEPEEKGLVELAFPGRTSLYVHEVARSLSISEQQVRDLIVSKSLHAINTGEAGKRKSWRIPIGSLRQFVQERSS